MKFLIPSYRRVGKVYSLTVAERLGFKKEDILISVQDKTDESEYVQLYGERATILYRSASTAGGNRNTLLSYLMENEKGIMLDDDVYELKVSVTRRHSDSRMASMKDIEETFCKMAECRARIAGAYPCDNHMFMQNSRKWTKNKLLTGAALFVIGGTTPLFDDEIEAMEDYEMCARIISEGSNTLRNNRIYTKIRNNNMGDVLAGKGSDGGCKQMYSSGGHERSMKKLLAKYGPILQVGKRGRSMRFRNI